MVLLYAINRYILSPDAQLVRHAAENQSPLHVLPSPVLIILAFACLCLAACVAGLTIGLMSLDPLSLEIVMQNANSREAEAARLIKPVREQGNLLLVTLLFANTVATELLPLVLEALVPGGYFSLVVSVVSIMLFGEIIPTAICSRHPLIIGAYMIGFVKTLRTILYPVAYPVAYLLDAMLGKELATVYNREELKGLIDVHETNAVLTHDETTILKGALEFSQKTVAQILTPAENVFRLDIDSRLDRETLLRILRSGHSRIPLYESNPNNIVCLLLVKQLVLVNPDDQLPIRSLISKKKRNHKVRVAPALECNVSTLISELLNEFQEGRSHMAIVYDDITSVDNRHFVGIISIEDIIEEILQEEIIDETDQFVDNTNTTQVLVRNHDGQLVRATAHNSHALHLPGTKKAVVVKEINVPALREPLSETGDDKIRPDWKPSKVKKKVKLPADPQAQPLLGEAYGNDIEAGRQSFDADSDSARTNSSLPQTPSPMRTTVAPSAMRYARMPGQSMTSLFGEDDAILPEDCAVPVGKETIKVSDTLKANPSGAFRGIGSEDRGEHKAGLKLRPLPEDASDEREVKIPPRKRATTGAAPATGAAANPEVTTAGYGSFNDDDIGQSEDLELGPDGLQEE